MKTRCKECEQISVKARGCHSAVGLGGDQCGDHVGVGRSWDEAPRLSAQQQLQSPAQTADTEQERDRAAGNTKGSSRPQQRTLGWQATCAMSGTLPLTQGQSGCWNGTPRTAGLRSDPARPPHHSPSPPGTRVTWETAASSPGPNDGLTGVLGSRVVHAVEVEPQQDLAPPLGLGVQDLDAGSHPGQRCVGASPAGSGRSWLQHRAEASGARVAAGVHAHRSKDSSRQTATLDPGRVSASSGTLRRQSAQWRPGAAA